MERRSVNFSCSLLLILLIIFSCSESNRKEYMKVKINNQIDDSSSIMLTVERGAFHNDKFVLKDTILTFYPSSEKLNKKNDKYNQISEQIISRKQRNKFIDKIIRDGFFKLKNSYSSSTSCNSHLTVTLKVKNQNKKIISEDFERNCPELLKFIEKEIIGMHSKNLIRVLLPG